MISYTMMMNCGCCETSPIYFNNDIEANAAVSALGLTTDGALADATGQEFNSLDTFCGIWRTDEDDGQNVIGKMISQLNK